MPKLKCRELTSVCVVDSEGRKANLASAMARGLPMAIQLPERDGPLAIVASGPSAREHIEEFRAWPGEVWAINGAYDFLLDHGIIPKGFFGIDPLAGLADYVRNPQKETTFFLASTSDPSVFDALKDHDVQLFHPASEDMEFPDGWVIGGGTTALTRVPYLGILRGWRDVTLFGADSSFDGRRYCYEWGRYPTDIDVETIWLEINGEGPFETEIGLLKQVSQMGVLIDKFKGRLKVRCGGLMAAFLRAPIMDPSIIEMEKGEEARCG